MPDFFKYLVGDSSNPYSSVILAKKCTITRNIKNSRSKKVKREQAPAKILLVFLSISPPLHKIAAFR